MQSHNEIDETLISPVKKGHRHEKLFGSVRYPRGVKFNLRVKASRSRTLAIRSQRNVSTSRFLYGNGKRPRSLSSDRNYNLYYTVSGLSVRHNKKNEQVVHDDGPAPLSVGRRTRILGEFLCFAESRRAETNFS